MKKTVSCIIAVLSFLVLTFCYSKNVNSSLSHDIVRLHVIANSDSKEDQLLKLKVRDAILKHAEVSFTKKSDVKRCLNEYQAIAENVIEENGFSYSAVSEYGNFSFPTKHYGNMSLPAGSYDAVRIKIGQAKGKNWWCVLFPPLCFVDGTTKADNAAEKLKSSLSDENYDLITAKYNKSTLPVEIKFKIVELYGLLCTRDRVYAKAGKD